ncbi:nitroreductase family protein [Hydrogenovibrio thermophilus]|uniref:Nitroreductase n=1 Tax=Hydrogenovibrio thermophilus TaxID=265883 RepID=A0A451G461_9GAMM|nr:nitroreductase [Hydrogenovibrio thermophilus]QAB14247.1 nitroreductase [Hydrogenovibrio thermophilus]
MSILQTIKSRRSVYQFTSAPVKAKWIDQCLEAAIWAPNHKVTEPWRFWVLGSDMQATLAHIYADSRAKKRADPKTDAFNEIYDKAVFKFQAIPKIVLVGQVLNADPVMCKEDYAACSCAIQNFQLAAWELGLGVQWSTGPVIQDERTFNALQIDSNQVELIGALYMGKPACVGESGRKPVEKVTTYLD